MSHYEDAMEEIRRQLAYRTPTTACRHASIVLDRHLAEALLKFSEDYNSSVVTEERVVEKPKEMEELYEAIRRQAEEVLKLYITNDYVRENVSKEIASIAYAP